MRKSVFILAIAFLSCNNRKATPALAQVTKPVEHVDPTADQAERRKQSEAYCKSHSIPIYTNPNAFFSDPETEVTIRSKDEVVDRALALLYIGLKSEGLAQKDLDKINKDWDILEKLSPAEKTYATAAVPSQQQNTDAGWRYEDLHVMLWALGFIDSLTYPDKMCDVAADIKIIHDLNAQTFRQKARLRSKKEILDQADLILQLDWACVNARVNNQEAPGKLDKGIVYERHYALNWLIHYANQNWDDVTTDT